MADLHFEGYGELQDYLKQQGYHATAEQLRSAVGYQPAYGEGDVTDAIRKLKLTKNKSPVQSKDEQTRYKKDMEHLRLWIKKRESALWKRSDYQGDLDKLAVLLQIPKEGFATSDAADAYIKSLFERKLWDSFKYQLGETVKRYSNKRLVSHSSSYLQLDSVWSWAVFNHLLRREEGREAARRMVKILAVPQIEYVYDRFGNEVDVHMVVNQSNMPITEAILRKATKVCKEERSRLAAEKRKNE